MVDMLTDRLAPADTEGWSYEDYRVFCDRVSDEIGEWQGVPVPIDDLPVILHEKHPLREVFGPQTKERVVAGGPDDVASDERLVNHWYNADRNHDVYMFQRGQGQETRAFAVTARRPPDRAMDRLTFWIRTMIATDAWDLDAEVKAMGKLGEYLSPRQRRSYLLTGSFMETSPRSNITYIFRRLRPTIALTGRHPWWHEGRDHIRCLAVLCLHPVGLYDETWAGCMCPTDDVIAHLLMMRGDEAYFWRKANQHDPASPEAGI